MPDKPFRAALILALLLAGCAAPTLPVDSFADPLRLGDAVAPRYLSLAVPSSMIPLAPGQGAGGLSARASSSHPGDWLAEGHLVDGNLHSAWAPATEDDAPSITLDLGQPRRIQGLGIKMEEGATFDVAVHLNGTWTTLSTGVSPTYRALDYIALRATVADRIKLTFHVQPDVRLLVCELGVFGSGGPATPTAAPSAGPGPSATPSPSPSVGTSPTPSPSPSATPSGSACLPPVDLSPLLAETAVLAYTTVTNTGPSILQGDLSLYPGTSITGFPPGTVAPPAAIHPTDAVAQQGQVDLTTAYTDAAGRTAGSWLPAQLSGQTLTPGVYRAASSLMVSSAGLTLDGNGDPDAVFIFQVGSSLDVASGARISLIRGAEVRNVFWQVGSSATLGTYSAFKGSILAQASITATTGATVDGRLLARTGAVTLDSNQVTAVPRSESDCR